MASPYFTSINSKSPDLSGITRGGQAMGEAYASIGTALGSIASTYFQKQKVKSKAKQAVQSRQGESILRNAGLDQEDIDGMSEDERLKVITGAIDEVGLDKFQSTQIELNKNRQLTEQAELAITNNKILLEQARRNERKMLQLDEISKHYYRLDPNTGTVAQDLNGFTKWGEYAPAIAEFAKGRNIKGFTPANFGSFINGSNIDVTDEQSLIAAADQWAAISNLDETAHDKVIGIAKARFIDPVKIQENFDNAIKNDKVTEGVIEQNAKFEVMSAKLPEAFTVDEETGEYTITNTTALMDFRRQLAKIGSGVGVMTDKDVDDYMGETDVVASTKRKLNQLFGMDEHGKSAPLSPEDAEQLNRLFKVTKDFHEKKARDGVRAALVTVDSTYPTLSRQKISSFLNPNFQKYFNDEVEPSNTDLDLNLDPRVGQAIRREFENGADQQEIFDDFLRVNPDMPEDKLRNLINGAVTKPPPSDPKPQDIPEDIRNYTKVQLELLGADNHSEAQSAVLGVVAKEMAASGFDFARRKLSKNHPLNLRVKSIIDTAIKDHAKDLLGEGKLMGSLKGNSAVQKAATDAGVSLIDNKGKSLTDKQIYEQMRKKAVKQAVSGDRTIKKLVQRLFGSPKALLKTGLSAGGFMLAYDLFEISKDMDGVIEMDEIQGVIQKAKKIKEFQGMPKKFWEDLEKDLAHDVYKRSQIQSDNTRYSFGYTPELKNSAQSTEQYKAAFDDFVGDIESGNYQNGQDMNYLLGK